MFDEIVFLCARTIFLKQYELIAACRQSITLLYADVLAVGVPCATFLHLGASIEASNGLKPRSWPIESPANLSSVYSSRCHYFFDDNREAASELVPMEGLLLVKRPEAAGAWLRDVPEELPAPALLAALAVPVPVAAAVELVAA